MALPRVTDSLLSLLKAHNLRDTQPRRLVIGAMMHLNSPSSPYDIQKHIAKHGGAVNTVTVYRVLDAFEHIGVVHKQPATGQYFLCSIPQTRGHHGFLHCDSCGKVEEFHSHDLCAIENKIAKSAGFTSKNHVSEISGICESCTA
jgi:Fe2+ or Zn2+ uptake regulation protein